MVLDISSGMLLTAFLLLLVATRVVAPVPSDHQKGGFATATALVVGVGEEFGSGEPISYHQNRCRLWIQKDGNLIVERLTTFEDPRYQYYEINWTSGSTGPGEYILRINENQGTVEIYDKSSDKVTFSSNNIDQFSGRFAYDKNHRPVITEECRLELTMTRIYTENPSNPQIIALWSNIKYWRINSSSSNNVIQKGEFVYYTEVHPNLDFQVPCAYMPYALFLQHDCNLIQFHGRDRADFQPHRVLWDTGAPISVPEDCFFRADHDKLRIYEGKYDRSIGEFELPQNDILWEADENSPNCIYAVISKTTGGLQLECD